MDPSRGGKYWTLPANIWRGLTVRFVCGPFGTWWGNGIKTCTIARTHKVASTGLFWPTFVGGQHFCLWALRTHSLGEGRDVHHCKHLTFLANIWDLRYLGTTSLMLGVRCWISTFWFHFYNTYYFMLAWIKIVDILGLLVMYIWIEIIHFLRSCCTFHISFILILMIYVSWIALLGGHFCWLQNYIWQKFGIANLWMLQKSWATPGPDF